MASSEPQPGTIQLHVPATDPGKHYLGNAGVVHSFVGRFADEVIQAYDSFLSGKVSAAVAQERINALIKEHGDALMGRDDRYEIAPWQGMRLKGKFLAAIPSMKGGDDPGEAFFKHLALQCVKSALALKDGHDEEEVGAILHDILQDARGRILGVIQ
ncbi:MAG: hypothetical protein ACK4YM_08035 [Novosphingobium sp.]